MEFPSFAQTTAWTFMNNIEKRLNLMPSVTSFEIVNDLFQFV